RYWVPEEGTPQGAVLSPLLSNIYLDPLDHLTADRGFEMVRYADDFVVL
ncbi:MAG: group II intron reverse transcriptase/maturase, partial [Candidatus Omnitrophica bacterium]|nr:group II intron reverse transcriptase/maturase [Candidatus Omnitrophota bacterium]